MAEIRLRPVEPQGALEYFRRKGLRPSFAWQDVMRAEHARDFTVAKAMQLDVLQAIRGAVDKALAEGLTLDRFRALLEPELRRLGWWGRATMRDEQFGVDRKVQLGSPRRLKIIFDTNLRMAYAVQAWRRIQRQKEALPYLVYVGIDDERTRPLHSYWQRQPVVLPVDHPWWQTHYPPNGWNCRCSVLQMSAAELAQRGWKVSDPPPVDHVRWVNRRSGEAEMVPRGIDPGFDYNPGSASMALDGTGPIAPAAPVPPASPAAPSGPAAPAPPRTPPARVAPDAPGVPPAPGAPEAPRVPPYAPPIEDRLADAARRTPPLSTLADGLRQADPSIARSMLDELLGSPHFEHFLARPEGDLSWPVMRFDEEIARAIGAALGTIDPVAVLSRETMLKQLREHPDLTVEDYRMLPALAAEPTWIIRDGDHTVIIVRAGDKWYVAAVKRTRSGRATFVTSFRGSYAEDVARLARRGTVIWQRS